VEYVYKSVWHGVGWRGDVKNIALSIDKIKSLGFKPRRNSTEAIRRTVLMFQKHFKANFNRGDPLHNNSTL